MKESKISDYIYFGGLYPEARIKFIRDLSVDNAAIRSKDRKYYDIPNGTTGIILQRNPSDGISRLATHKIELDTGFVISGVPECFIDTDK